MTFTEEQIKECYGIKTHLDGNNKKFVMMK